MEISGLFAIRLLTNILVQREREREIVRMGLENTNAKMLV